MAQTHEEQKKQQLEAMQMQRFGHTEAEIVAAKGRNCYYCGKPISDEDLVIAHIHGGGRHATEMGKIIPGKTHNMDNLAPAHRACNGRADAISGNMGLGLPGNPNNPA